MRTYTQGEKYEIHRVLDKVYEFMEKTDNHIYFQVGAKGVQVCAYNGDLHDGEIVILDSTAFNDPFTEFDADRMMAELEVLSYFNRAEKETDTTEEE